MNIRTACFIIGNGNRRRGHDLVSAIAVRIIQARKECKAVESEAPGQDVDESLSCEGQGGDMSDGNTKQQAEALLAEIYDSTGDKLNGACPVCSTYTHKGWCWYPRLLEFLGKPMDEHDKAHLERI